MSRPGHVFTRQRKLLDEGDLISFMVRIPKRLHHAVRVQTFTEGRTLTEWIGEAVLEHLAACQERLPPDDD